MTIVTGRGLELSLTESGTAPAGDESQAQMLAAVGHPPSVIERESGVSPAKAQMYKLTYKNP